MPRAITRPAAYYGSKAALTLLLLDLLPRRHQCYAEPFFGMGSLLFAKSPSAVEVIADNDQAVVSFFRVLRAPEHAARLMELLRLTPYARLEWEECRAGWRQTTDEVELARRWYTAIFQAYSGHLVNAGWSYTRQAGHNPAVTWRSAIEALPRFTERLRAALIEHGDYETVIRRYDGPEAVFYCDPPYPMEVRSTADRRYTVEMDLRDHRRLLKLLTSRRFAGMVLLSCYDGCELYERALLPAGWQCVRAKPTRVSSSKAKMTRTEVVWMNPALIARRARERRQASLWASASGEGEAATA